MSYELHLASFSDLPKPLAVILSHVIEHSIHLYPFSPKFITISYPHDF